MRIRNPRLAAVLAGVTLSIAAAGATYAWKFRVPRVVVDADHCPQQPVGTWLVAFDTTDQPPAHEQKRIITTLTGVAERMQKHERLALHVMSGNATDSATPIVLPGQPQAFNRCKPADPKTVNRLIENERKARQIYQREFLMPLLRIAPQLARGGSAKQSPILEAVDALMWAQHFRPSIPRRTLVVISDLEQRSAAVSFAAAVKPDLCKVLRSPLGQKLAAHNWTGVNVVLEYIRSRDSQTQNSEHLRFWTTLFYRLGAAEVFDGATLIGKPNDPCERLPIVQPAPHANVARKK